MQEVTPIKLGPNLQPEKCCYLSACQHHALCLLASSLPACLPGLLLTKSERPVNKRGRARAPGCRSANSGFVQAAGAQSSRDYRDEWTTRELWAKLRKLCSMQLIHDRSDSTQGKKGTKKNNVEVASILSFTLTWPLSHEGIIGCILWCAKTTSDLIYTTITP